MSYLSCLVSKDEIDRKRHGEREVEKEKEKEAVNTVHHFHECVASACL